MCADVQMIGFMEATAGEILINGCNIKTHMDEIYTYMVRRAPIDATRFCS